MTKILRCYAKKEQAQWVAVCIDLGLAAQADSLEQAKRKLESMVETYIQEAVTIHRQYAKQLLTRKATLSQRLEYYVIKLGCQLTGFIQPQNPKRAVLFTENMQTNYA